MKNTFVAGTIVCLLICWALTGCDTKPNVPSTASGTPAKSLTLSGDPLETQAVTELETAFANYRYRVMVIRGYYQKIGNMDKAHWADEELMNLSDAKEFQWDGLNIKISQPTGESAENADEMLLAEYVVGARNAYKMASEKLLELYKAKSETFKASVIHNMMVRLNLEHQRAYFTNAEVPGPDLKPRDVIPEAEALYADGLRLYREGKILPAVVDYKKERQALTKFIELVHRYPASTRIAMSAFYIGEIYKEYFNVDTLAVRWYQRAWEWDPAVTEDARFQAAVVWDHRLHNRDMALALYKEVLKFEQSHNTNIAYSQMRIKQLTEQK